MGARLGTRWTKVISLAAAPSTVAALADKDWRQPAPMDGWGSAGSHSRARLRFQLGISMTTSDSPLGTHWQPRRELGVRP
ncbi:MAG: hypothetical protein CHACPFDD_01590 [Phycisphaerae bacterium]|nr:hypothetical protein [Phycisphaerae bacterium]